MDLSHLFKSTNLPKQYPVYAKSGWEIPQSKLEPMHVDKLEAALVKIRAQEVLSWHPNAKLRSASNFPYNCMGLVFALRRAVIDVEHVYSVLKEDSFRAITRDEVVAGDIALYKFRGEPSHVGMITHIESYPTKSIVVLSRWGFDGEYEHFMEDVPEVHGIASEFYTERVL
jgi:hypothetical protein